MFHGKYLCIYLGQRKRSFTEVVLCDIGQNGLNIVKIQQILKVINKYQKQDMILGVFFTYRRGKEVVFGIVIDHSLCEYLVLRISLQLPQVFLHKGSYLVHIKVDLWDIFNFYVIQAVQVLEQPF